MTLVLRTFSKTLVTTHQTRQHVPRATSCRAMATLESGAPSWRLYNLQEAVTSVQSPPLAAGQGPNNKRPINMGHLQTGSLVRGGGVLTHDVTYPQLALSKGHASHSCKSPVVTVSAVRSYLFIKKHSVHFRLVLTVLIINRLAVVTVTASPTNLTTFPFIPLLSPITDGMLHTNVSYKIYVTHCLHLLGQRYSKNRNLP
jgi:hypothetical protein